MDQNYLLELMDEAKKRDGGLILNIQDKPEIVVLTVEKYNELLQNIADFARGADAVSLGPDRQEEEARKNGKNVLVTGGAGYIGTHICRELIRAGYDVLILDNLSTGKRENVPMEASFVEGDVGDVNLLKDIFAQRQFYAVVHLAASLEVGESVSFPELYLRNNAINTERLLSVMAESGVKRIIFSSTAAVYGQQPVMPITENAKVSPDNPYGYSKLLAERIIKYYCHFSGFQAVVFRYFNACGCDFDGGVVITHQSHLIPTVMEVALGQRPYIMVNGSDYGTFDGTCIRDYVHVLDIARAHVLGLEKVGDVDSYRIYNIGTGRGYSVREIISKASEVVNKIIPMEIGPRRPGDAAVTIADNSKLRRELGFELRYSDLDTILRTALVQLEQVRQAVV